MAKLMDEMSLVLRRGAVDGPVLYATQKLVSYGDVAASNLAPRIPQELRTPLLGLLLGTAPLMLSNHWLAEKISEYSMANAVAQTIALAGNKGSGTPGPIDQAVNKVFAPIASIGMKGLHGGFPSAGMHGYMAPTRTMHGYVQPAMHGYVQAAGGMGNSNPRRQARLRGMSTTF